MSWNPQNTASGYGWQQQNAYNSSVNAQYPSYNYGYSMNSNAYNAQHAAYNSNYNGMLGPGSYQQSSMQPSTIVQNPPADQEYAWPGQPAPTNNPYNYNNAQSQVQTNPVSSSATSQYTSTSIAVSSTATTPDFHMSLQKGQNTSNTQSSVSSIPEAVKYPTVGYGSYQSSLPNQSLNQAPKSNTRDQFPVYNQSDQVPAGGNPSYQNMPLASYNTAMSPAGTPQLAAVKSNTRDQFSAFNQSEQVPGGGNSSYQNMLLASYNRAVSPAEFNIRKSENETNTCPICQKSVSLKNWVEHATSHGKPETKPQSLQKLAYADSNKVKMANSTHPAGFSVFRDSVYADKSVAGTTQRKSGLLGDKPSKPELDEYAMIFTVLKRAAKVPSILDGLTCSLCQSQTMKFEGYLRHIQNPNHMRTLFEWIADPQSSGHEKYNHFLPLHRNGKDFRFCEICAKIVVKPLDQFHTHCEEKSHAAGMNRIRESLQWIEKGYVARSEASMHSDGLSSPVKLQMVTQHREENPFLQKEEKSYQAIASTNLVGAAYKAPTANESYAGFLKDQANIAPCKQKPVTDTERILSMLKETPDQFYSRKEIMNKTMALQEASGSSNSLSVDSPWQSVLSSKDTGTSSQVRRSTRYSPTPRNRSRSWSSSRSRSRSRHRSLSRGSYHRRRSSRRSSSYSPRRIRGSPRRKSRRSSSSNRSNSKRLLPKKPVTKRKLSPANLNDAVREALTKKIEETWQSYYHKYYSCINTNPEIVLEMQKEYLRSYKGFFKEDPYFEYYYIKVAKPEDLREALTLRIDRGSPGPDPNDPHYKAAVAQIESSKFPRQKSVSPTTKRYSNHSSSRLRKSSPKRTSRHDRKRSRSPSPYHSRRPHRSRSISYERKRSRSRSYDRGRKDRKYQHHLSRRKSRSMDREKQRFNPQSKPETSENRSKVDSNNDLQPVTDLLRNKEVNRIAEELLKASGSLQPWLAVSAIGLTENLVPPSMPAKPEQLSTPQKSTSNVQHSNIQLPKPIIKKAKPNDVPAAIKENEPDDTKSQFDGPGKSSDFNSKRLQSSNLESKSNDKGQLEKPDEGEVKTEMPNTGKPKSTEAAKTEKELTDPKLSLKDNKEDRFKFAVSSSAEKPPHVSRQEDRFMGGESVESRFNIKAQGSVDKESISHSAPSENRFQSASSSNDRFKEKACINTDSNEPVLTSTSHRFDLESCGQKQPEKKTKSVMDRLGSKTDDRSSYNHKRSDRSGLSGASKSHKDRGSSNASHSRSPSKQYNKDTRQQVRDRDEAIVEIFADPFLGFVHKTLTGIILIGQFQQRLASGEDSGDIRDAIAREQKAMHERMVTADGHLLIKLARCCLSNISNLSTLFPNIHEDVGVILKNLDPQIIKLIADTPIIT